MGKYSTFFCAELTVMLRITGVVITILSYGMSALNVKLYIDSIVLKEKPSMAVIYFTMIATVMYGLTAFEGCWMICLDYELSQNKFFNAYNVFAAVSTVCAFIDGVLKLYLGIFYSLVYFAYCLISSCFLFVTCVAQKELNEDFQNKMEQMNANGVQIISTGHDGVPKFSMPVQVTKVEMPAPYELEPMNKATEN